MHTKMETFIFGVMGEEMVSPHSSWACSFWVDFFVACKIAEKSPIPDTTTETGKIGFAPVEGSVRICLLGKPQFLH